jgi:co-chaperonin GroES (HSP10)
MMMLKPLGAKVLLNLVPKPTLTASGLVLVHDKPLHEMAKVVGVGPDVKYLHEGDVVIFDRYAAVEANADAIVIAEANVLAVIEKETEDENSN